MPPSDPSRFPSLPRPAEPPGLGGRPKATLDSNEGGDDPASLVALVRDLTPADQIGVLAGAVAQAVGNQNLGDDEVGRLALDRYRAAKDAIARDRSIEGTVERADIP